MKKEKTYQILTVEELKNLPRIEISIDKCGENYSWKISHPNGRHVFTEERAAFCGETFECDFKERNYFFYVSSKNLSLYFERWMCKEIVVETIAETIIEKFLKRMSLLEEFKKEVIKSGKTWEYFLEKYENDYRAIESGFTWSNSKRGYAFWDVFRSPYHKFFKKEMGE